MSASRQVVTAGRCARPPGERVPPRVEDRHAEREPREPEHPAAVDRDLGREHREERGANAPVEAAVRAPREHQSGSDEAGEVSAGGTGEAGDPRGAAGEHRQAEGALGDVEDDARDAKTPE